MLFKPYSVYWSYLYLCAVQWHEDIRLYVDAPAVSSSNVEERLTVLHLQPKFLELQVRFLDPNFVLGFEVHLCLPFECIQCDFVSDENHFSLVITDLTMAD